MPTLWQTVFHVCAVAAPILFAVATHNYAAAASGAFGLVTSLLATYGVGGAGVASLFGAIIAHHKTTSAAAAALPTAQAVSVTDQQHLLDLQLVALGRDITEEQYKAFVAMREAVKSK